MLQITPCPICNSAPCKAPATCAQIKQGKAATGGRPPLLSRRRRFPNIYYLRVRRAARLFATSGKYLRRGKCSSTPGGYEWVRKEPTPGLPKRPITGRLKYQRPPRALTGNILTAADAAAARERMWKTLGR